MTINDKILQRVRKLITLANNGGATDGERDNALRMAHATLAKYNLDMSMVEGSGTEEGRKSEGERFLGQGWYRQACHGIADAFFCGYFYQRISNNTDDIRHYFVGKHSNAVTALEISKFVVASIHKEATAYRKASGGNYKQYRAFAQAACQMVVIRCAKMKKANEVTTVDPADETKTITRTGTALVLASLYQRECEANDRYTKELLGGHEPKGVASKHRVATDWDARGAGAAYGKRVSLSQQITQDSTPAVKQVTHG